jgi:hypothetical protein
MVRVGRMRGGDGRLGSWLPKEALKPDCEESRRRRGRGRGGRKAEDIA